MRFTDALWQDTLPIFDAILRHPFIAELTNGSLSRERFVFYMKQDSLYLRDFARSLAITGARLPDQAASQSFLGFALGATTVEALLHENYFSEFGVTLDVGKAPACFAYTNYLLAMASTGLYAEACAALLPCFWIYREVGKEIVTRAKGKLATNPYARWIETYSGVEFDESVTRAIDIVEALATEASESARQAMRAAYETSSRLEWLFWDSAYRLEQWPPRA
jgi:thiaminase/transcriptional activator TenA